MSTRRSMTVTFYVPEVHDAVQLELGDQAYRWYVRAATRRQVPMHTVLHELVLSLLGVGEQEAA